jgi:hypothetical protein
MSYTCCCLATVVAKRWEVIPKRLPHLKDTVLRAASVRPVAVTVGPAAAFIQALNDTNAGSSGDLGDEFNA